MKRLMFSIYDSVAEVWKEPICDESEGQAIRSFQNACNNPESMLNQYPEDYFLYVIGEFSLETGLVKPVDPPRKVGGAMQFIVKKQEEQNG